jgi:hypothetical protein
MAIPLPVIAIGTASQNAAHARDLGRTVEVAGVRYRLFKMSAALTACASKVLVTAVTSGTPTWLTTTTTSAANSLVACVVPIGQVGSDGSTGLLIGDYFYGIIQGYTDVITVTGATAISTGLQTSTTAGQADPISGTFAATTPGACFAYLTEAANAGAASGCRVLMG